MSRRLRPNNELLDHPLPCPALPGPACPTSTRQSSFLPPMNLAAFTSALSSATVSSVTDAHAQSNYCREHETEICCAETSGYSVWLQGSYGQQVNLIRRLTGLRLVCCHTHIHSGIVTDRQTYILCSIMRIMNNHHHLHLFSVITVYRRLTGRLTERVSVIVIAYCAVLSRQRYYRATLKQNNDANDVCLYPSHSLTLVKTA